LAASRVVEAVVGGPSLGQRATHGFAWLVLQALGTKAARLVCTLVLAAVLAKPDFGLVGLATTVAAFAGLLRDTGLGTILVQRHAKFDRWATPAFWMALTAGLLAAIVMVVAAPLTAGLFRQLPMEGRATYMRLVFVLALASPFEALLVVPQARLQSDLRFRASALVGVMATVTTVGLQLALAVPLARAGLGAFAVILPLPLVALGQVVTLLILARVRIRPRLQVRRWRYLFRDTGLNFGISMAGTVVMQGDNLVLGLLCHPTYVATYFFTFNLASQPIALFCGSLQAALFPTLAKMAGEPARQLQSYLRVVQFAGVMGCLACALQGALARPLMHVFFGSKWDDAVPLLRLLSLNMAIALAGGPTGALFQAQGRFYRQLFCAAATAAVFLIGITIGAWYGDAVGVAAALCVVTATTVPMTCYLAIRPVGGRWRDVARLMLYPLGTAAVSFIPLLLLLKRWHLDGSSLVVFAFVGGGGLLIYVTVIQVLLPGVWRDGLQRFRSLMPV